MPVEKNAWVHIEGMRMHFMFNRIKYNYPVLTGTFINYKFYEKKVLPFRLQSCRLRCAS